MPIGEKLFEEEGKTAGQSIKSVGPEGVTLQFNFVGEGRGVGRLQGLKGRYFGTGTLVQGQGGPLSGGYHVIITTEEGESILLSASSLTVMGGGKVKDFSLLRIATTSQKYAWLNQVVAVRESDVSPDFQSFSGSIYEWK